MERVTAAMVALGGLAAILLNRRFARAGVISSREFFGRRMPEGGREYRFTIAYGRVITIAVGILLLISGTLGVFGIDWRSIYQ